MTVLTCAVCGTTQDGEADGGLEALAWVATHERGQDLHLCPRCARDNLRAIEAKLDVEYF